MLKKGKATVVPMAIAFAASAGCVATASAGSAVVTSGGSVSAMSPSFRLVINGSVAVNCTGSSASATVANGTASGVPAIVSSNFQIVLTGCIGPLGLAYG